MAPLQCATQVYTILPERPFCLNKWCTAAVKAKPPLKASTIHSAANQSGSVTKA